MCATWVCAWRQRQRPGDPARQRTTQCVCRGCVCVCGRPCVCAWGGGVCLWCVGRDTGIVSQPGKGQHCVCLRVCVYVCVRTRMCVWCGPGVCVLVGGWGGARGSVWRVCDMPRWCCVGGVCSPVCGWVGVGGRAGVWCGCVVYRCHRGPGGRHGCARVACACGCWGGAGEETEAERHRQAKDNTVCVCVCVCVCGEGAD